MTNSITPHSYQITDPVGNIDQQIFTTVSNIPFGETRSYGEVAQMIGRPRAARVVGWSLGRLSANDTIPWWRVVNREGMLSIRNTHVSPHDQRVRLEAEGVMIEDRPEGLFIVMKKS